MSKIIYAGSPLALLLLITNFACLLGYGILQFAGDIMPLAKLISKITQLLLILSIFPLKKFLHLSWSEIGFACYPIFFKQLLQGFLLALATLFPVLLCLYVLDIHIVDTTPNWTTNLIVEKMSLSLFLALLIALSEETLFRGILLSSFRHKLAGGSAIIISALYYAALHFLKSKSAINFDQLTINSGFQLMAEAFSNWLNPAIISAFISLLVVGVFLAILRSQVPQSLGLCIGCHCGWVWQIKLSKDFLNVNPQADYLFLISNYDGVIGPLVSVWLILALIVFRFISNRNPLITEKKLFLS